MTGGFGAWARRRARLFIPALLVLGVLAGSCMDSATPPGQSPLVSLDSDLLMPVRECFNQAPEEQRLLLLFSPT